MKYKHSAGYRIQEDEDSYVLISFFNWSEPINTNVIVVYMEDIFYEV